jgi:hypothetical protein
MFLVYRASFVLLTKKKPLSASVGAKITKIVRIKILSP